MLCQAVSLAALSVTQMPLKAKRKEVGSVKPDRNMTCLDELMLDGHIYIYI